MSGAGELQPDLFTSFRCLMSNYIAVYIHAEHNAAWGKKGRRSAFHVWAALHPVTRRSH